MSLEALADEIAAQAKAEAKALKDEAKKTAKSLDKEAEAEVAEIREAPRFSRPEREATRASKELVASSRQDNQKRELIAKGVGCYMGCCQGRGWFGQTIRSRNSDQSPRR